MITQPLIPSSFLPPLPKSQNTLEPLHPPDILAHISILRELYIPPIHGGLQARDTGYSLSPSLSGDNGNGRGKVTDSPSIGLGLGLGLDTNGSGPSTPRPISQNSSRLTDTFPDEAFDDEAEEDDEDEDESQPHLDSFEREWAERWLGGIVRRAQTFLEEGEISISPSNENTKGKEREMEMILRDATAVLAMMAGTSAAGSLTRHLLFPISPSLETAWTSFQTQQGNLQINQNLSPTTTTFLNNLSISPTSPVRIRRINPSLSPEALSFSVSPDDSNNNGGMGRRRASTIKSQFSDYQPSVPLGISNRRTSSAKATSRRRRRQPVIPILLHDAPMSDHLSVGVQTWGSAILLGREMALRPDDFGLFPRSRKSSSLTTSASSNGGVREGTRVLELGAGTGLLSILCRKLLDLYHHDLSDPDPNGSISNNSENQLIMENQSKSLVIATDFLPSVLDNLKICVDLNFPILSTSPKLIDSVKIGKLDWKTFPEFMALKNGLEIEDRNDVQPGKRLGRENRDDEHHVNGQVLGGLDEELMDVVEEPFDLVLASDCVYDSTHAKMLREVVSWVLRLPEGDDPGGTFHILSPIRPTFTPELESIDQNFPPLSSYSPLSCRAELAEATLTSDGKEFGTFRRLQTLPVECRGEGLGLEKGLKIGVRGEKRKVEGRKGEGRVDEVAGYWWWEVGWG